MAWSPVVIAVSGRPSARRRARIRRLACAWTALAASACRTTGPTAPAVNDPPSASRDHAEPSGRAAIGAQLDLTLALYTGGTVDIGPAQNRQLLVFFAPFVSTQDAFRDFVQALAQRHHERVDVIAVVDDGHARQLDLELDLSLAIAFDPQSAAAARLGLERLPTAVLLDRRGIVVARIVGEDDAAQAELERRITEP
ncbi:MAG: redoxin domain-containing protein [Myxococcales bacterium FL481]|nr:MAG: redoxin domain-containing protein [Myxococcales bacterium FL481]